MQFLIDFAECDEGFARILRRAAEYPTVQGVVLGLDRYWVRTWQMRQEWGDAVLANWAPFFEDLAFAGRTFVYPRPITRDDVEQWRPPGWENRQDRFGLKKTSPPWIVRVCLRPRRSVEERLPTAQDFFDPEGRLRVQIETRPIARLASDPRKQYRPVPGGVSIGIGTRDFGTLGITLQDGKGRLFALTCAHVAPMSTQVWQPAQHDGRGTTIGSSVAATHLATCSASTPCNPWSGAAANELDLSLIEIDPKSAQALLEVLDIGQLSGIATRASLSSEQGVEVMGRTTGFKALQIGGLAAWYRFHLNDEAYCFKNLFEVQSPYGQIPPIQGGDSGAAVCADGPDGKVWCGMIVGNDAYKGYAIYSETAMSWLHQNIGVLHLK